MKIDFFYDEYNLLIFMFDFEHWAGNKVEKWNKKFKYFLGTLKQIIKNHNFIIKFPNLVVFSVQN